MALHQQQEEKRDRGDKGCEKKGNNCERFGSFGNVEVTPIWTNSTVRADRSGTDSEQVTTCSNQQQQQKNII
jgi:hypothetical protein